MAQWTKALDDQITRAINNPRTTLISAATLLCAVGSIWIPRYAIPLGLTAAAVGHWYAKDAEKGSTMPNAEADAAVTKVEKMAPNSEPR